MIPAMPSEATNNDAGGDSSAPAGTSESQPRRILVFGNSGSGKSTLAASLAAEHGIEHLDLDPLAWQPTEPPTRLPLEEAAQKLRTFGESHSEWVVEGCYADLLELLSEDATSAIFLDLPVAECQANARKRPWEPHKYASKEAQDAKLEMLLDWIAEYPEREDVLGRRSHEALFDSFAGVKERRVALVPP